MENGVCARGTASGKAELHVPESEENNMNGVQSREAGQVRLEAGFRGQ